MMMGQRVMLSYLKERCSLGIGLTALGLSGIVIGRRICFLRGSTGRQGGMARIVNSIMGKEGFGSNAIMLREKGTASAENISKAGC
jgi:hypothetical protein